MYFFDQDKGYMPGVKHEGGSTVCSGYQKVSVSFRNFSGLLLDLLSWTFEEDRCVDVFELDAAMADSVPDRD
jgi:hypothetical protein